MTFALVEDLFFLARIRETARQKGVAFEAFRSTQALLDRARAQTPGLVLVDLNLRTEDAVAFVRRLRAEPTLRTIRVVGWIFDSHEERMLEAEQAGCTKVLSRGQLTRMLPELLDPALAASSS